MAKIKYRKSLTKWTPEKDFIDHWGSIPSFWRHGYREDHISCALLMRNVLIYKVIYIYFFHIMTVNFFLILKRQKILCTIT